MDLSQSIPFENFALEQLYNYLPREARSKAYYDQSFSISNITWYDSGIFVCNIKGGANITSDKWGNPILQFRSSNYNIIASLLTKASPIYSDNFVYLDGDKLTHDNIISLSYMTAEDFRKYPNAITNTRRKITSNIMKEIPRALNTEDFDVYMKEILKNTPEESGVFNNEEAFNIPFDPPRNYIRHYHSIMIGS